jgi:hypothetical protein
VPRHVRGHLPSGIYHVANRGIDDAPIYVDDVDRKTFLALLGSVVARHEWTGCESTSSAAGIPCT